jgi:uncharacterized membrane protein
MRLASIRFIAYCIGLFALYLGLIAIPIGLFSGVHVLAFGLISFVIAYRFIGHGNRVAVSRSNLLRLQVESFMLAVTGSVLTFSPLAQLEKSSLITWAALIIVCGTVCFLALLEQREC